VAYNFLAAYKLIIDWIAVEDFNLCIALVGVYGVVLAAYDGSLYWNGATVVMRNSYSHYIGDSAEEKLGNNVLRDDPINQHLDLIRVSALNAIHTLHFFLLYGTTYHIQSCSSLWRVYAACWSVHNPVAILSYVWLDVMYSVHFPLSYVVYLWQFVRSSWRWNTCIKLSRHNTTHGLISYLCVIRQLVLFEIGPIVASTCVICVV